MEHLKQKATQLVTDATRGFATVRREGDFLDLALTGVPTLRLKMELWRDEASQKKTADRLWILKNPTVRTLNQLRDSGASFAALNGAVRVIGPGIVIDRTGVVARTASRARRQHRSAFSDRASLVARWLFRSPPGREWPITMLAERSGVSASVASYAVSDLEERGLLTTERRGRERWVRSIDHLALIRQWTSEYSWRKNYSIRAHAPIGSPIRFLRRLKKENLPRWAAALQTGARLLAPHAPAPRLQLYVDLPRAALSKLIMELEWSADDDGDIELFVPHYRRSAWHWLGQAEGIPVLSTLQLILDLWDHPLRGREQADILLEKHLLSLGR